MHFGLDTGNYLLDNLAGLWLALTAVRGVLRGHGAVDEVVEKAVWAEGYKVNSILPVKNTLYIYLKNKCTVINERFHVLTQLTD